LIAKIAKSRIEIYADLESVVKKFTLETLRRIGKLAVPLLLSGAAPIGMQSLWAADFVVGVGTHLTGGSRPLGKSLDMLSAAGVTSFRDDATWSSIEKSKGIYSVPARMDQLVDEALKRKISPLLILAYGNRFYDDGGKPLTDESILAFTKYAEFVVRHFKGRVSRYEIWNEWEHTTGKTAKGSPEAYVRLARKVYPAIKKIDPQAEVLVGAVGTVGIKQGYLERIIRLGILEHGDMLTLHPYMHCERFSGPESWARWMRSVGEQLENWGGKPVSVYLTEMGWPSHQGRCGVSEETQAEYLRKIYKHARELPFIKGIWWYDLQNDGNDPADQEHNFGLVRGDFTEKPAYKALREMAK